MPIITAQERIGTVIDEKIRLDRILGEGGFGVVYAGMHLKLERPVAVKFLHGQFSQHPAIVERFLTEARATSRLSHPNVIDVRDVAVAPDGAVYMVLELLKGQSLGDYLQEKKRLGLEETLTILTPVMDALAAAHDAKITHRDIKPDNIFLSRTPEGRLVPKVLDFGIAKLADGGGRSATATGSVMGTPVYMSPEQAMGRSKEIGPPADVWSTAVMIYECLTGTYPFDLEPDAPPSAIIYTLMAGPIVSISMRRPDLPPAVADVLMRALERDLATRTPSMRRLADDLVRAIKSTGPILPFDPLGATMVPVSELLRADTEPVVRSAPFAGDTGPIACGVPSAVASEALATGSTFGGATLPEVGAATSSALDGRTVDAMTTTPAPRGRRRWLLAAGIGAALVAVGSIAAAASVLSREVSVPPSTAPVAVRPVETPAAAALPPAVRPALELVGARASAPEAPTEVAPATRPPNVAIGFRAPRGTTAVGTPPGAPAAQQTQMQAQAQAAEPTQPTAPLHPASPTLPSVVYAPPPPTAQATATPTPAPPPPIPVVPPVGPVHRAGSVSIGDF